MFDQKLSELNREGISFITLRRRSEKMLREIYSQPDSAWQRISLPALTRIYRNPKVLENRVTLPGYEGELRQLTVMELGHEEPTVLLTNHRKLGSVELVTRYAQRMLIENGISEAVQFFHIDALSSMSLTSDGCAAANRKFFGTGLRTIRRHALEHPGCGCPGNPSNLHTRK